MNKTLYIGIIGHKGVGKDTTAAIIRESVDGSVESVAFADKMKEVCQEVFNFSQRQLYGPSQEREVPDLRFTRPNGRDHLTPRHALQTLGDWGRQCDPNIWVQLALDRARRSSAKVVIFTDCRFVNEARALSKAGAYIIRVRRPQVEPKNPRQRWWQLWRTPVHNSERDILTPEMSALVDREILNAYGLDELRAEVRKFLYLANVPLRSYVP